MARQISADLLNDSETDFRQILSNPILDIAARFWEVERYEAFKVCYRSMRVMDDLVDDLKAAGAMPASLTEQLAGQIIDWIAALNRKEPLDSFQEQLLDTAERFSLPLWPWERLSRAMLFDLQHDGFRTWLEFRRYCEGAAVAPAAVFMHLCGVRPHDGRYFPPPYDIRRAARPLALFSYLVHIMRDFEKDQRKGLNYFPRNLLDRCGLTPDDMQRMAAATESSPALCRLMALFRELAESFRVRARTTVDRTSSQLAARYQLSLEIIYHLYLQIFERVDSDRGDFTTAALNPLPEEVREQINRTVVGFNPVPTDF